MVIDVCGVEELPPGSRRVVAYPDGEIMVVNVGGELFAIEDRCSHDDGPLEDGAIDLERCTVECPRHGALFDLRDGRALTLPAYQPVRSFPVLVRDGIVRVDLG